LVIDQKSPHHCKWAFLFLKIASITE